MWHITYHGCVTDQCRKTPAKPRSIISVTTALPFLNSTPARAGSRANANDSDASEDESLVASWSPARPMGCGFSRSRASLRLYSEKLELRRGNASPVGDEASAKGLCSWMDGRERRASSTAADAVRARRRFPGSGALTVELAAETAALCRAAAGVEVRFSSMMAATIDRSTRRAVGEGG